MPELPEVETLCRWLDGRVRDEVIDTVEVRSVAALKTYDPPVTVLHAAELTGCRRHGKFIDLVAPPHHLVFHLARGGWLRWRDRPGTTRPALRGPLALVVALTGGSRLEATEHGTDKRLAVYVVGDPRDVPGIARLGIDAMDPALTEKRLLELLGEVKGTLKTALADQSVIAGIGNAYSDEILHAAALSPFRRASALGAGEAARLSTAIRTVLTDAVARASALDPSELKGDKRSSMRVHGRAGLPCPVCGDIVREVSLGTRSFQYCPGCQTGGRVFADRRMNRLLR